MDDVLTGDDTIWLLWHTQGLAVVNNLICLQSVGGGSGGVGGGGVVVLYGARDGLNSSSLTWP